MKQKKAPVFKQIKIEPFVNDRFAWHKAKRAGQDKNQKGKVESTFPLAPPGATMAISFQSDEEVLSKLRDRLCKMSDEQLIRFGK